MERTNTFQLNHPPLPRPLDRPGRLGTAGDVLKLTGQPLHSGCIAGLPDRILVVSSGLAVSMLAVTGTLMWLRNWRKWPHMP